MEQRIKVAMNWGRVVKVRMSEVSLLEEGVLAGLLSEGLEDVPSVVGSGRCGAMSMKF